MKFNCVAYTALLVSIGTIVDGAALFERQRDVNDTVTVDDAASFELMQTENDTVSRLSYDNTTTLSSGFRSISLDSKAIKRAQPFTGMLVWDNSGRDYDFRLAFMEVDPEKIVDSSGNYNWDWMEDRIKAMSSLQRHAILRIRFFAPSALHIPSNFDTVAVNYDGETLRAPDWSSSRLQDFAIEFVNKFAARYDSDPRVAYVQLGFGFWGEFHLAGVKYTDSIKNKAFPPKEYVHRYLDNAREQFRTIKLSVSIDAGNDDAPDFGYLAEEGRRTDYGFFDDTFMNRGHSDVEQMNAQAWNHLDWSNIAPTEVMGGTFGYDSSSVESQYLDSDRVDPDTGVDYNLEYASRKYFISYLSVSGVWDHLDKDDINRASRQLGYKFYVTKYGLSDDKTQIVVQNRGNAPLYFEAILRVDGKPIGYINGIQPSESVRFTYSKKLSSIPEFTVECDKLFPDEPIDVGVRM
eukprot:CFRG6669T1